MECGGIVRPAGAARIPIQFVASSTYNSRNKQFDGQESSRQLRYQQHRRQHQQLMTSSRGSQPSSTINGRLHSSPPESLPPDSAEWDPSLRTSRAENAPAVRPTDVICRPDKDRRPRQRSRPSDDRPTRLRAQSDSRRTVSSGTEDSLRKNHHSGGTRGEGGEGYSSGDDSGDDVISRTRSTSTRSPGADSSTPRTFRVEFDVEGYNVDDISVRLGAGRRLLVHGVRREMNGARTSTTEFCRKIRLPDDVDSAHIDCYLQPDGRVVVEAPRQQRSAPAVGDGVQEPLNLPVVTGSDRRQLGLVVEVGRLFRADDVVVKVKNSALTLTVAAERTEPAPGSVRRGNGRLNASVTWEFDLPATVDVDTLRAGLTVDGLLRVTARLTSALPPSPPVVNSTL